MVILLLDPKIVLCKFLGEIFFLSVMYLSKTCDHTLSQICDVRITWIRSNFSIAISSLLLFLLFLTHAN
ncbi:hypothetical protein GLYMA_09G055500v4 [Glycine max]|uniref:Uncharacterized protein n=1 Tax=Glycine max TaxID=3847 RepID=A0A0R0IB72_SOYBN|nr:hypothetical protein GYH30_024135 [Glycine max]KRH37272.1 hypothetical protein GLYMA_09G055500v4 [Glycine max]